METYTFLRELADSWVLLAMFGFFISVILWVFRPGSTEISNEIAQIPLRDDNDTPSLKVKTTSKNDRNSKKGARNVG